MKGILGAIAIGAATLFSGGASQAAVVSVLTPFTGDQTEVTVTLEQEGTAVRVTAEVTGALGDLRGVFLSWSGFSSALTYFATGADITAIDWDNVSSVGSNSNNINPESADLGVEIGTQGIGGDDIQLTSFLLGVNGGSLLESDFVGATVYARVMSVLVDGAREGSSKLSGELEAVPLPAASFLLIGGLAALGFAGRRKRAA